MKTKLFLLTFLSLGVIFSAEKKIESKPNVVTVVEDSKSEVEKMLLKSLEEKEATIKALQLKIDELTSKIADVSTLISVDQSRVLAKDQFDRINTLSMYKLAEYSAITGVAVLVTLLPLYIFKDSFSTYHNHYCSSFQPEALKATP